MLRSLLCVLFFYQSTLTAISRLPEEFFIQERIFALSSTFDISTDLESLAVVSKKLFTFSPAFDLLDNNNQLLASAASRFFAWGTVADITDSEGKPIGRIEEDLWHLLPWAEYRLFNALDQIVAIARMDVLGTEFILSPPDSEDHVYATVSRPLLRCLRDAWAVRIFDYEVFVENRIDPRLLIMLSVYQTNNDNRNRWKTNIQELIEDIHDF